MNHLQEHLVLVVGASRGIGREIAIHLAKQQAIVCLLARSQDQLHQTAQLCNEAGGEGIPFPVDVTDYVAVKKVIDQIVNRFGRINITVFSQGIAHHELFIEDHEKNWQKILAVNLLSCMYLTQLILPHLITTQNQNYKRSIIYMDSISGKTSYAGGAAYCASKHGLLGFAHAIFEEMREHNIKIVSVCPGYVNTSLVKDSDNLDRERMIQPSDIAITVSDAIHSPLTVCPVEIVVRPQRSPYRN